MLQLKLNFPVILRPAKPKFIWLFGSDINFMIFTLWNSGDLDWIWKIFEISQGSKIYSRKFSDIIDIFAFMILK